MESGGRIETGYACKGEQVKRKDEFKLVRKEN